MNHIPVLLDEVLRTLGDISGKTIVDCTFGAGGYSRAFLERGANVIAFDRDPSVIPTAEEIAKEYGERFRFINAPFSEMGSYFSQTKSPSPAKGIFAIVFDLGISSMQIDTADRGFSWRFDAPLDMRMNQNAKCKAQSANELIKTLSIEQIAKILRDYGDVKKSGPIARAIKNALPQTTFQLRDLIHNPKDIAPVFQALRIAVNDEMGELERALAAVPDLLATGGICICVTFHSLEDRIVKSKFREWTTTPGDPRLPTAGNTAPFQLMKTLTPSDAEIDANPRARSAHLRAVRKGLS